MRDLIHFVAVVALCIAGISVIFAIVSVPLYLAEQYKCSQYANRTNRLTDYSFATGCFVEGVPMEEFTARAVTNEQR